MKAPCGAFYQDLDPGLRRDDGFLSSKAANKSVISARTKARNRNRR